MHRPAAATTIAWPLALAAAAIAGTLATACMMPFVAVATLAAATMPRAQGVIAVIGIWAANQLLGFGLLGYPWTAYAAIWGVALGAAALAAMVVARAAIGGRRVTALRLVAAFAVAFAGFEVLLFGLALVTGGLETFTPAIIARLLANDAVWLVALTAFHLLLTRAAPRLFGRTPALRFG